MGIEILTSDAVYTMAKLVSPRLFKEVQPRKKKSDLEGVRLYKVYWDDKVKFDPTSKILLVLKPVWALGGSDFPMAWKKLLGSGRSFWQGKVDATDHIKNDALALVVKDLRLAIGIASDVLAFIGNRIKKKDGFALLPLQIALDMGPFLRAGKLALEGFDVDWDRIDPGEISISSSAYRFLQNKSAFSTQPPFDSQNPLSFYRLIPFMQGRGRESVLFLYQNNLIKGRLTPCFYCGDKNHHEQDCPSKQYLLFKGALKKMALVSLKDINALFFRYLTQDPSELENTSGEMENPEQVTARDCFFELNAHVQIRTFRTIWDTEEKYWEKAVAKKGGFSRGGHIWVALDCIRVGNYPQAEQFLNSALDADAKDYKLYCAMGFHLIDKGAFKQAGIMMERALNYVQSPPQKILLNFLLFRLYVLDDNLVDAEKRLRDILSVDPRCPEAMYESIKLRFKRGQDARVVNELKKFVQSYDGYFVATMIDPDLAPFHKVVHPLLEKLLEQIKQEAKTQMEKAEQSKIRLEVLMGENQDITSMWGKMKAFYNGDSYRGYHEAVRFANMIITRSRKLVQEAKADVYERIFRLDKACERQLDVADTFPKSEGIRKIYAEINDLRGAADDMKKILSMDTPGIFKQANEELNGLEKRSAKIYGRLTRLLNRKKFFDILFSFIRNTILFQGLNLVVGIMLLPILAHYITLVVPSWSSFSTNLWAYQKGCLIVGGISGIFLAFLRSLSKTKTQ